MARDIIFDCDDVLLNWQEGFHHWMLVKHQIPLNPEGPQSWDMDAWVGHPALPFIIDFNASESFGKLDACSGAQAAIAKLYAAGHRLHVITACSNDPVVISRREQNLDRVFGDVFTSITCVPLGASKGAALATFDYLNTVWVEDNYQNALSGAVIGHETWMMRRPHNRTDEIRSHPEIRWVDDFNPILSLYL